MWCFSQKFAYLKASSSLQKYTTWPRKSYAICLFAWRLSVQLDDFRQLKVKRNTFAHSHRLDIPSLSCLAECVFARAARYQAALTGNRSTRSRNIFAKAMIIISSNKTRVVCGVGGGLGSDLGSAWRQGRPPTHTRIASVYRRIHRGTWLAGKNAQMSQIPSHGWESLVSGNWECIHCCRLCRIRPSLALMPRPGIMELRDPFTDPSAFLICPIARRIISAMNDGGFPSTVWRSFWKRMKT